MGAALAAACAQARDVPIGGSSGANPTSGAGGTSGSTGTAGNAGAPTVGTPQGGSAGAVDAPVAASDGDAGCLVGATRCSPTGSAVEVCTSAGWKMQQACPVCTDGACSGTCTPGDKQCAPGQSPQTCGADGQWAAAPEPCPNACTGKGVCSGECKPGTLKCGVGPDSLMPFLCSETGMWMPKPPACTNLCSSGSCSGSCAPKSVQCMGNSTQVCSALATWEPGTACVGKTCVDGACAGECGPTDKRCNADSNTPQTCDGKGSWKDGTACSGKACVNGTCVGSCEPKKTRCGGTSSSQPQICNDQGAWVAGGDAVCCGNGPGQVCCEGTTGGDCQNKCGTHGKQTCQGGRWVGCSVNDPLCCEGEKGGDCTDTCGKHGQQTCQGGRFTGCSINQRPQCCSNSDCNGGVCQTCSSGSCQNRAEQNNECMGLKCSSGRCNSCNPPSHIVNGQCVKPIGPGLACGATDVCANGLTCAKNGLCCDRQCLRDCSTKDGHCGVNPGSSCSTGEDCITHNCMTGLFCSDGQTPCSPEGSACGSQGNGLCQMDGICQ
jgi:hypothetical protein